MEYLERKSGMVTDHITPNYIFDTNSNEQSFQEKLLPKYRVYGRVENRSGPAIYFHVDIWNTANHLVKTNLFSKRVHKTAMCKEHQLDSSMK